MKTVQLFFLHFAGGNCYSFDFLIKEIKKKKLNVKPYAIELPGRGNRIAERLLTEKPLAIKDYFEQIKKLRNGNPYIIFGHSMGAALGLSVVKEMEKHQDPPLYFIASGTPGPGIVQDNKRKIYQLNDHDFKNELRSFGGVPEQVLSNDELFMFFSTIIRADFKLLEQSKDYEKDVVIDTPIYALMGDKEPLTEKIENWKSFTNSSLKCTLLPGNHFFIHNNAEDLVQILSQILVLNKLKC